MIWKNASIGLAISIEDSLLDSIVKIGIAHYPNEFGGFLIGSYAEEFRQLSISDNVLPNNYKGTPYLFERNTDGLEERLEEFYSQTPQKYYVGEWHTHPDGPPVPSATDLNAMKSISNHAEVAIKNPVLLIIGYKRSFLEIGFYVFIKNKLHRYEFC